MNNLMNVELALPGGSLESYISNVNQVPMLTEQEEYQLAKDLQDNGDLEAARRLVMSHLRFVVRVARGYNGYGLPMADLVQEGNVGLMKAVKRFNPEMGVRLVSFAVHWIRAEMHEFILKNWRIVKVATTKAQRKLFFNLRSSKKRLGWMNQDEVNAVAGDLGVSAKDVLEMEKRLNAVDNTFDMVGEDSEDTPFAPVNYLESASPSPEQAVEAEQTDNNQLDALHQAMTQLDDRTQDIIRSRWLQDDKATLHDLAAKYDISAERVRQLEKNAMNKLKAVIPA